ncbi:hypothetical protein O9929_03995 [Vibrio lentus]|nr:hypothetical protein [Vibrio lentus]
MAGSSGEQPRLVRTQIGASLKS